MDINQVDQVAGDFADDDAVSFVRAFFWENDEIFNFNDYVDYEPGEEIVILRVHDINNAGVILATVIEGDAFLGRSVMLVPK